MEIKSMRVGESELLLLFILRFDVCVREMEWDKK